jgi:glycine C-acetyltransferase
MGRAIRRAGRGDGDRVSESFYDRLGDTLAQIERDGFTKRERRIASPQQPDLALDTGAHVVNFCANN